MGMIPARALKCHAFLVVLAVLLWGCGGGKSGDDAAEDVAGEVAGDADARGDDARGEREEAVEEVESGEGEGEGDGEGEEEAVEDVPAEGEAGEDEAVEGDEEVAAEQEEPEADAVEPEADGADVVDGGEGADVADGADGEEGEAAPSCGNGTVEHPEECDDFKNGDPDDGCTDGCAFSCHDNGECDDGRVCTTDTCDTSVTHACSHAPKGAESVCRAPAGVCDAEERCTGTGQDCPAQGFKVDTLCRASLGVCDVSEHCTGSAAACPSDLFEPVIVVCRALSGACDVEETCGGSAPGCGGDAYRSGNTCRTSAGVCDMPEACAGTSTGCPGDSLRSGAVCRAPAGACDAAELCDGTAAACPANGFASTAMVCRAEGGVCDLPESCTGTATACPANALAPTSVVCRGAAGVCDAGETCTGSATGCPADALRASAFVCRALAGVCDAEERCTSSAPDCPSDLLRTSITTCRAAAGTCDVAEACTGTSGGCPADGFRGSGYPCDDGAYCTGPDGCDGDGHCGGAPIGDLHGVHAASAGVSRTCAATSAGVLKCWGAALLGDGTAGGSALPVDVRGLAAGARSVDTGGCHTCAVTSAGGAACWGCNSAGQLGDRSTTERRTPVAVHGLGAGVLAVSLGASHSCALVSPRGARCWGINGDGQLGDASTVNRSSPVEVFGLGAGVAAVSSGANHSYAVTTAGGVKCWGENAAGQLGNGSTMSKSVPQDVLGLTAPAASVAAFGRSTCVLTSGGGLLCWGDNDYGQLGDGSTFDRMTPGGVAGLAAGVAELSAYSTHACALTTGGGVLCWGNNGSGQLGNGTLQGSAVPVPVPGLSTGGAGVAAGLAHSCAVTTGGALACWGANNDGQLGDGSRTASRPTPVGVTGLPPGATTVAAGNGHSCSSHAAGGTYCWGSDSFGQLGSGDAAPACAAPAPVAGLSSGVPAVAAGNYFSCAVLSSGGVRCWGDNFYGQVGDGSTTNRASPAAVAGLSTGVAAVSTGGNHACAVLSSGGARCWGANAYGQLGNGSTGDRATPVAVAGLSAGVAAVSAGGFHSCALTASGGLLCWGYNLYGQLGDGGVTTSLTPVGVAGATVGMAAVAAGQVHTCALTAGGGVTCWGGNSYGQLGIGNHENRTVPVAVVGLSSGVVAVDAGSHHTCAVTAAGGVACWGNNEDGRLGDGSETGRATPVGVAGLTAGVLALSAGGTHTCVIMSSGDVRCWGAAATGQVTGNRCPDALPSPVLCN